MHRETVRKYMLTENLVRKSYKDRGMIENYFNYIKKRMEEDDGRHMGYLRGYSTLSDAAEGGS